MPTARKLICRLMRSLPNSLRSGVASIRTSDGGHFKIVQPFNSDDGRRLFVEGEESFEPETALIFRGIVKRAGTFMDIGANIGFYALIAKYYNPAVKVFAFEPEERAYTLLVESIQVNGWVDVTAERLALADFDGNGTLYLSRRETEASLNQAFRSECTAQPCLVRTLDSYCREHEINRIDFLVIDTESTEPQVLAGGREVIGDCKPDIICEVLKGRTEATLMHFLKPLGYRFYHLTHEGPVARMMIEGDPTYRCLNYLFTTTS